jgi:hypothetical protein
MQEHVPIYTDGPKRKEKEQDPYARIRTMPEVVSIEPRGQNVNVPAADQLDFTVFGEASEDIAWAYLALENWLKMPFIEDTFGDSFSDHEERRVWRGGLKKAEKDLVRLNKYRNNHASVALGQIQNLEKVYEYMGIPFSGHLKRVLEAEPSRKSFELALKKAGTKAERRELLIDLEKKVVEVLTVIADAIKHAPGQPQRLSA